MEYRFQPLRRGSSQISDLGLEFDPDGPPTPVFERSHTARRELPLDLEKCQGQSELEQRTPFAATQGYKSHSYPHYTPPLAAQPPPPTDTKGFICTATLYFGIRECPSIPCAVKCLLTLLNFLEIFLWWFVCAAALAGASHFEAHPGVDFEGEELEVQIPWWYAIVVLASLTAISRLTTWGAKLVMGRFGGPTSGIWFCVYEDLPPFIALVACWFVHLM